MLLSKAILRVIANPFAAPLDAEGRPCAFVMHDPEHPAARPYLGAELRRTQIGPKRERYAAQQTRYRTTVHYDLAPVPVVDTDYHRKALRSGQLFAADAATAKVAQVRFTPPEAALAAARAEAIAAWAREHNGEPPPIETWQEHGVPEPAPAASTPPEPSQGEPAATPAGATDATPDDR